MSLRIRILGGCDVRLDGGGVLGFPTRKARALLAFLAVDPTRVHPRERLMALLWPESSDERARASLRQALAQVRKAMAEADVPGVQTTAEHVRLDPTGISIDVAEFEAGVVGGAAWVETAGALYRGDLLDGLVVAEDPFEEWLRAERLRLRELAVRGYTAAIEEQLAAGRPAAVVPWAERLIAIEPTCEAGHRALMRAAIARGDQSEAMRRYQRCAEVLGESLGVRPSPETEALRVQALGAQKPAPAVAETAAPADDAVRSIAILPFENLSGAPDHDYLVRGLVEDLQTELSRFRELRVIAGHSARVLAGRGLPLSAIARELGVGWILTGSVRRSGARVRVSARLHDAPAERQAWAETYDSELAEVPGVEDEIVRRVVGALALRIGDERLARVHHKPIENLAGWDLWLRGQECLRRGTLDGDADARALFQRALDLDPRDARAHSGMSLAWFNDWSCQAWERWEESHTKAFECARRAADLDDSDAIVELILGRIHLYRREFDQAELHLARAVSLNPNNADILVQVGFSKGYLGEPDEGVELARKAMDLNPLHPEWYFGCAALPAFVAGHDAQALAFTAGAPTAFVDLPAISCAAEAHLGDLDAAREHLARFRQEFRKKIAGRVATPEEEDDWLRRVNPFRRARDADRLLDAIGAVRASRRVD